MSPTFCKDTKMTKYHSKIKWVQKVNFLLYIYNPDSINIREQFGFVPEKIEIEFFHNKYAAELLKKWKAVRPSLYNNFVHMYVYIKSHLTPCR